MNDITNQFAFTDFIGYLFPGMIDIAGLFALFFLPPLNMVKPSFDNNLVWLIGILYVVVSYVTGVLISTIANPMARKMAAFFKYKPPEGIPIEKLDENVVMAFQDVFGVDKEAAIAWTDSHFMFCRAMVSEYMPTAMKDAQRQEAFTILRRNLLPSIDIWAFVGIMWGGWWIYNGDIYQGISLLFFSLVFFFFISKTTVARMVSSYKRERKYIVSGFVAGYKSGAFDKRQGN